MADKTLTCQDCGQTFTFTGEEQEFFAQKGFSEPKRCPSCRAARKAERGNGRSFGGGGSRQMFSAICAECGKETEVPFEPTEGRPVYCRDCFSRRSTRRSRF